MVSRQITPELRAALEEITNNASDRVLAVVGGAILDEILKRAMQKRFREKDGNSDINEKLFKVSGPLGNFGPKIDLAYQLGMIEKPQRNAMYGISDIRNIFAHTFSTSFDSKDAKLTAAFQKLKAHEGKDIYCDLEPDLKIMKIRDNRDLFFVNLTFCIIDLILDEGRHLPNSNIPA